MTPASFDASPPSKSGPAPKVAERTSKSGQGGTARSRGTKASSSTTVPNKAAMAQNVENPFDWHAPGRESAVAKLVAELEAKTRLARSASASGTQTTKAYTGSPLYAMPPLGANTATNAQLVNEAFADDLKTAHTVTSGLLQIEIIEAASASFPAAEQHRSPSLEPRPLTEVSPSRKLQTSSPTTTKLPATKSLIGKAGMDKADPCETSQDAEMRAEGTVEGDHMAIEQHPHDSPPVSRTSPYSSGQRKASSTAESVTHGVEQSESNGSSGEDTVSADRGSRTTGHPKKPVKKHVDRDSLRKAALAALSTMPLRSAISRTYARKPTAPSSVLPEPTSPSKPEQDSEAKIAQLCNSTSAASSESTKRASRLSNMYGFSMQLDGATLPVDRSALHRSPAITDDVDQLADKRGDIWANGCSSNDLAEMEFEAKEEEEEVGLGQFDKDAPVNSNEGDQSSGKLTKSATTKTEKRKRKRKSDRSDTALEASDGADPALGATSSTKTKRKKKGKKEKFPADSETGTPQQKPDTPSSVAEQIEQQPDAALLQESRSAVVEIVASDPGYQADSESISRATDAA